MPRLMFFSILFSLLIAFTGIAISETPVKLRPPHVQQEAVLIASMQDGKVNTYRVVDTELNVVCYVTVGELHGKTVTQDCFSLYSLGTMWMQDDS